MSRLTRNGTAEPVSRDQILRRERGQGNINFPFPADHVQDWQPYPVDPYSCYMCDHTIQDMTHDVWYYYIYSVQVFIYYIMVHTRVVISYRHRHGTLYFFVKAKK